MYIVKINTKCLRNVAAKAIAIGVALIAGTELSVAGNLEDISTPTVAAPATTTKLDVSGFYTGGSLAYGFGDSDDVGFTNPNGALVGSLGTLDTQGLNYGLRLGWRNNLPLPSQERLFVYGFELGYDLTDIDDSFITPNAVAATEINNVFSLKYKGGITNSRRNTLFYTTLGYINADIDYGAAGSIGGDSIALIDNDNRGGLVVGLGVERAISQNLSALLEWEYNYIESFRLFDGAGASTVVTPSFNNIRIGLNYSF